MDKLIDSVKEAQVALRKGRDPVERAVGVDVVCFGCSRSTTRSFGYYYFHHTDS